MRFHLGNTGDFVGNTAVNSRFLVLAFSRAYEHIVSSGWWPFILPRRLD